MKNQLARIESVPYESIMMAEYENLNGRCVQGVINTPVPHMGNLLEEVCVTVNLELLSDLIRESINNEVHLRYNMSKREFMMAANRFQIAEFEGTQISSDVILPHLSEFLYERRICFMNMFDEIKNHPVYEVW